MTTKKIHRFIVSAIPPEDVFSITDTAVAHQIHRVLKIKTGEKITIFCDRGPSVTVSIVETSNTSIVVKKECDESPRPLFRTVIAAISIIKGDAFELAVQKLAEIGVSAIVPIISSRTIKQSVKIPRLQAIADEATEQCGGTSRLIVHEPMTLANCFEAFPFYSVILEPESTNTNTGTLPEKIIFYVGPEGGWDEHDEEIITQHKTHSLQLTNRILRTETAAIVGAYTLLW